MRYYYMWFRRGLACVESHRKVDLDDILEGERTCKVYKKKTMKERMQ